MQIKLVTKCFCIIFLVLTIVLLLLFSKKIGNADLSNLPKATARKQSSLEVSQLPDARGRPPTVSSLTVAFRGRQRRYCAIHYRAMLFTCSFKFNFIGILQQFKPRKQMNSLKRRIERNQPPGMPAVKTQEQEKVTHNQKYYPIPYSQELENVLILFNIQ